LANEKNGTLAGLREKRGLTRTQAAVQVGISEDYLAKLERGDKPVTDATLVKLSRAYGITVERLEKLLQNGAAA